jgi:cytochrome c peroxidase
MAVSRLCLQLAATASDMSRREALRLLAVICLCAAGPSTAQEPAARVAAVEEPITAIPAAPSQDPRQVAFGDRLFHDPRLSHDNTRSCNSCHDTTTNGARVERRSPMSGIPEAGINTPTVFNSALNFRLNWEGNQRTLESQIETTVRNPETMGSSLDEAVGKLRADPELSRQFLEAYGRAIDGAGVVAAISAYERTLLTPGSRFDLWLGGDIDAITPKELAGYELFKSLGCVSCHQGVNVGGNMFQRHGIFHPLAAPQPEVLRVPSLRNVAVTAPYFHDGSAATLPEAVKAMGFAQLDRVLTDDQTDAIVAFLRALTGTYQGKLLTAAGRATQQAAPP